MLKGKLTRGAVVALLFTFALSFAPAANALSVISKNITTSSGVTIDTSLYLP